MLPRKSHLFHLTSSGSNKRLKTEVKGEKCIPNQDFKTVHLVCNSPQGCRQLGFPQTSFTDPAYYNRGEEISSTAQYYFILAVTLLVNNTESTE